MTYSTLIFASVMLPISVLFLFFDRSTEYKNLILCVTSFLFVTWGINSLAGLMFLSVFADCFFAIAIENMTKKNDRSRAIVFFIADILMNGFLFLLLARNELFEGSEKLSLAKIYIPAGAAFYTLKNFSYVYDVFTGRCSAERNPFRLLTYGMNYAFLLAGPVVRYKDIEPQLKSRRLTGALMSRGLKSFAIGFAKTVILLPVLKKLTEAGLYGEDTSVTAALVGMLAWFGTAWFGFTGLSDMGTGIACMNGFDVPLNYERLSPKNLIGGTIRCYNTSMIDFFKDIRGVDNKIVGAVLTVILAVLGAGFYSSTKTMLIIGAIAGVILAAEYMWGYDNIEKLPSALKAVIAFIAVFLLFSPMAFESFGGWKNWLGELTSFGSLAPAAELKKLLLGNILIVAVCIAAASPIGKYLSDGLDSLASRSAKSSAAVNTLKTVCIAALLAVSYILLAAEMIAK